MNDLWDVYSSQNSPIVLSKKSQRNVFKRTTNKFWVSLVNWGMCFDSQK